MTKSNTNNCIRKISYSWLPPPSSMCAHTRSETSILILMSGNGRRGRRLTLAPAACRAQRPSAQFMEVGGEDDEEADDHSCKEGRAALSRAVALAADACIRPKPIHGVSSSTAIPFKFWMQDDDSDLDEEDGHGEPTLPVNASYHLQPTMNRLHLSSSKRLWRRGSRSSFCPKPRMPSIQVVLLHLLISS